MAHFVEHVDDLGINGFEKWRVVRDFQELNEHLLGKFNPFVVHHVEGYHISGVVV